MAKLNTTENLSSYLLGKSLLGFGNKELFQRFCLYISMHHCRTSELEWDFA